MGPMEWIGLASGVAALLGAGASGVLWIRNGYARGDARLYQRIERVDVALRAYVDGTVKAERDNSDRVYAQRADVARLEERLDAIGNKVDDIHRIVSGGGIR